MPKVSVIVPVYNVEDYLEQCVKSILSQTLEDIEVLLVNDASTDGSLKVARSFETDKRVRVLEKPHGGLGDTRNYGAVSYTHLDVYKRQTASRASILSSWSNIMRG